jgi:hypothetical protein
MKPFARLQQEAAFRLDRNPVLPFTWRRVQKVRGTVRSAEHQFMRRRDGGYARFEL